MKIIGGVFLNITERIGQNQLLHFYIHRVLRTMKLQCTWQKSQQCCFHSNVRITQQKMLVKYMGFQKNLMKSSGVNSCWVQEERMKEKDTEVNYNKMALSATSTMLTKASPNSLETWCVSELHVGTTQVCRLPLAFLGWYIRHAVSWQKCQI